MKKKVLALLVTFVMMFTMVGCNAQGVELINELKTVSTWEAMETKSNLDLSFTYQGESFKANAEVVSYSNSKDLQMEATMTIKNVEFSGQKIDVTKAPFKISPIKFYMDGMKFYVSTSFIKDVAAMAGVDPSTLVDVSKDYLALDLTSAMEMSGMSKEQITKLSSQSFDIYTNSKIDVPIIKKDNTYTVELKDSQLVDTFFDFCVEVVDAQTDTLTETYKAMGLTDDQIKEVLAQVKAIYGPETKAMIKPMINGSTAKASYTFNKDSYVADMSAAIKVAVDKEKFDISVAEKSEVKKVDKKAITFPTSVKVYTMEDLMAMTTPSQVIEVAQKDCIVEKGVTYVPLKATLAKVGLTVGYDSKAKTTYIKELNNMPVKSIVKKGVSYVSVDQLAELGLVCEITK